MSFQVNPILVQKRKDLLAAYRHVTTTQICFTQEEAWKRTVKQPAPRFYIGGRRAANVIYEMRKGNFAVLEEMSEQTQQMYHDLLDVVLRLSQKREYQGRTIKYIVKFAVLEPAPQFYTSPETLRRIYRNARRYGIDFYWPEVDRVLNKKYTNRRDGKPKDAVYKGKIKYFFS